MSTPAIQLWNFDGAGLILLHETGVRYSNQTGGYACLHPEAEGAFLPLTDRENELQEKLYQHFTGPKWNGWCCEGIDAETADFIDELLSEHHPTKRLTVDRSQLDASHEAWVYVNVEESEREDSLLALFSGFPAKKAILVWANSD